MKQQQSPPVGTRRLDAAVFSLGLGTGLVELVDS